MTAAEHDQQPGFGADRPPARPETIVPGSALYTMLCDATIAVYSLPLFIAPLLHPATADATNRHDRAFTTEGNDPVLFGKRLWNTMEMISGVVYAGDESDYVAHSIRELHRVASGELPSGESYHAWTRDIWSWNWAAITSGVMDVYGAIRRFPDDRFRDDAYLGMVEIGRRFGVLGMPATYPEFSAFWPTERDRVADPTTAAIQRLASLVRPRTLDRPHRLRRLPVPLWDLLTWPIRHPQRVAMLAAIPAQYQQPLGLVETRWASTVIAVHRTIWRIVPRKVSHRIGLRTLHAHHRDGTPSWRSRYSEPALQQRREWADRSSA